MEATAIKWGFTCKQAKRLTFRSSNQGYCMIVDRDGQEWLVDAVLDNGRLMILIKPETDGKITKQINSDEYSNFMITLDGDDVVCREQEGGK